VAEVGTAFGSDSIRRVNARLSGEQGAWRYNINAVRFETDGWRDHSAAQRTGFNGKFKYSASADTKLTFVLNSVDMPDVQDPLGLTRAEMEANPRQASPAALLFNTRKSVDQRQGGAILEHRLDAVHSIKLTGWLGSRGTEQFQAIPVATQTPPTHPGGVIDLARDYHGLDAQWVAKTQLMGTPFTVTAGLSADQLKEHRRGLQNFVGTTLGVPGALRRDEDNKVRSFDQYLQAQWSRERFSLTAGVRHSRVTFDSRDNYIVTGNGDDSGSARYSAVTPVLGAVFHANEHLNLYAALGKGFETPTFNELAYRPGGTPGLNFGLRSADSRQWELGAKAELAPQWALNAALFQARTEDEIVVLSNAGGRSTFQNAGQTKRRGFEAALTGRLAEAWSLAAVATWLDATYASDFLTCVAAPCTTPNTPVAAGSRIPGIPRVTAFAELAWRHRPWGLETALEWRHIGRLYVDDRNTDFAPRASLWNLRLGLAQNWNHWRFREFIRLDNVTDRRYVGSVIVNEGNRRFFEPAPGRNWLAGVNASYTF
jgi:iron complex outermembrane receptor protein